MTLIFNVEVYQGQFGMAACLICIPYHANLHAHGSLMIGCVQASLDYWSEERAICQWDKGIHCTTVL